MTQSLRGLLRYHEILRMANAGRIPPSEYRYETEYVDGRKQVKTFEADEDGRVKNLKIWVEDPEPPGSKSKRRGEGRRKSEH